MIDTLYKIVKGLVPTGSLAQRTVKSGIWVSGIKFFSRFSQILMLIILARLLAPRDFGLMGIALVTLAGTQQFTKIGLKAALIQQKQENVDDYLDTTWCLEAGRGLLIAAVLFVTAPYIAMFFGEPDATNLIRVIGLGPLLFGLKNPGIVYFEKDLEFHKQFVYEVSGGFAQFIVGVTYALINPTVWALVFAFVATDFVKFVLSYALHDYRPWPSFDIEAAKELIDYGKWITGSSIVYFLYSQGDDAFVGWFLSATALGFYQYAYRIADTPSSEFAEVISSVTFPAYSKLQDNTADLRDAVLQTTRLTAFVAFPMSFGIALIAPSFVPVVLGPEWTPMIVVMQLLALYGLLHALTRNFGSVWKAIGRPDYITKLGILRVFLIAVLIWPATAQWGIEGTALVVVGVYVFPMLPLDVYIISGNIETSQLRIYREYLYPFVAGTVMFSSLWYLRTLLDVPDIVEMLILIPSGAVVYVAAALFLEKQFTWGIEQNIRTIIDGLTD